MKACAIFNPTESNLLIKLMNGVFNYVAADFIQLVQETENRYYLKREEVIEVVLDAGRLEEYVKSPNIRDKDVAIAVLDKFRKLSFDDQEEFCKKYVFTYSRYS